MSKIASVNRPDLNPILEAALGCMDIQLEEELARYRRHQSEQRPKQRRKGAYFNPVAPVPMTTALVVPSERSQSTSTTIPPEVENKVADLTQAPPLEPSTTPEAPQEYLESSEKLLQNLTQEEEVQGPPVKPSHWSDRLLTPVGVGSVLAIGITSTLVGIGILNHDRLVSFEPSQPTPSNTATPQASPSPLEIDGPNLAADEFDRLDLDSLSTIRTSPSPATLPVPEATPATTPQVSPTPEPESDLANALIPPNRPQPKHTQAIPTPETVPTPAPSPLEPPPIAVSPTLESSPTPSPSISPSPQETENVSPGPSQSDFYYVLTQYDGALALEQARSSVPDAYLRQFPQGVQIQMGAFSNQSDAEKLVEQLNQKGIPASIYRP